MCSASWSQWFDGMISRTATRRKVSPPRQGRPNPDRAKTSAIDHAVRVVHSVCCLAGAASLIDDIRADQRAEGMPTAIRRHDTATLFDWLISALSYQGISDQVAADYMERHGRPRWTDVDAKVAACPTCQNSKATGIFTVAGTTRSAGHVQSPITSIPVPCPPTSCATVGSTRWPTLYSCSYATLLTAIWSAGSTDNSKMPMTRPVTIGSPDCGKL
jgi:hypothetical protein